MAINVKNKISGLLMEAGAENPKKRLHGRTYFKNLLETVEVVPQSVKELLKLSHAGLEMFATVQKKLLVALRNNELIREKWSHSFE